MNIPDWIDRAVLCALFALAAAIYQLGRLVGRDDERRARERREEATVRARNVGILP